VALGRKAACFIALLLGWAVSTQACSTPVFQYAMQRWAPDYYRAYVFHKGELDAESKKALEALRALAEDEDAPVNLGVGTFDVSGKLDREALAVYTNAAPKKLPRVVVAYPYASRIEGQMWDGPLSMRTVETLSRSRLCDEMAKHLIEGTATVWIFVECDNKKLNEAVFARLGDSLKEVTETVNEMLHDDEVPGPPVVTPDGQVVQVEPASFSYVTLRLSREDTTEEVLVASLLNSEPGLRELREPMMFPVFGRGRVLCAFVGKGINSTNILAASEFMGGPCSCQVKAMNPGFDLLVGAYWDDFVDHMGDVVEEAPPELTRVVSEEPAPATTPVLDAEITGRSESPGTADQMEKPESLGFVPTMVLVLAGLAVLVVVGTAMYSLRAGRMREE